VRWSARTRILVAVTLATCLTLGLLFVTGRILARRIETVPRAVAPWGPATSFLSTRSGRVHILDVGKGDPILLVHGSGSSIAEWQEGFADLLASEHRVIAFDSYGFGLSDRNHPLQYGLALWSRQAVDVLDGLEIERAVVLGHSAGGAVAALLAADHPERFRGAVFVGHGVALDPAQALPLIPGIGEIWAARNETLAVTFPDRDRHRERMETAYRIRGTRAAFLVFVRRQFTIDGFRLLGAYEDIHLPVLQVHGTLDESIPIDAGRDLGARLANSRFVAVSGSGHHVHLDAPDRLAEEVGAFVEVLEP
jgi:2-hydroxymuconate-semialdehyde hydrolase